MELRTSLQRIARIINLIKKNPHITFNKLQEELKRQSDMDQKGTSRSTLQRYLKEIREEFGIEIIHDKRSNGYYIDEENSEFERLLETFQLFNFYSIWDKLPESVLPEKHAYKGAEHLQPLLDAIQKKQQIKFDYRKYSPHTDSERILEPYALKEYRGRWYVIGKEKDGRFKTFGLDRIKNLRILPDKFAKDPDFNLAKKYEHSFGIFTSDKDHVEEIILAFDERDGDFLKSVPLHHSQEILKDSPEEFIIKLKLRITIDFKMEILSRSRSLRVIAPESLRLEICSILEKALERNR